MRTASSYNVESLQCIWWITRDKKHNRLPWAKWLWVTPHPSVCSLKGKQIYQGTLPSIRLSWLVKFLNGRMKMNKWGCLCLSNTGKIHNTTALNIFYQQEMNILNFKTANDRDPLLLNESCLPPTWPRGRFNNIIRMIKCAERNMKTAQLQLLWTNCYKKAWCMTFGWQDTC